MRNYMMKNTFRLFIACLGATAIMSCGKKVDEENTVSDAAVQTEDAVVDLECANNIVAAAWSDDPDADAATILAESGGEYTQASVDTLIDLAIKTDDECAIGN